MVPSSRRARSITAAFLLLLESTCAQTISYWGAFQVSHASGTFCLDAGGLTQGGAVVTNVCSLYTGSGGNGNAYHAWALRSDGSILSLAANMCIDDNASGTSNGNRVQIYGCSGASNQKVSRALGPRLAAPAPPARPGARAAMTGRRTLMSRAADPPRSGCSQPSLARFPLPP